MSIFGFTRITNGISKCAMFVDIAETNTKLRENQNEILRNSSFEIQLGLCRSVNFITHFS